MSRFLKKLISSRIFKIIAKEKKTEETIKSFFKNNLVKYNSNFFNIGFYILILNLIIK